MEHYIDQRKSLMLGFIEVLNDLGLNILYIDRTFYVFSDFVPADPTIGADYITVVGKNITREVESAIQKEGYNEQVRTQLFQSIDAMKSRRREFSASHEWKKYLASV